MVAKLPLLRRGKSALACSIALLTLAALAAACRTRPSESLQRFEFGHPAMGTLFTTTLYAPDSERAQAAARMAFARVDELETVMSDYQADSELMLLCAGPAGTPAPVSADLFDVLWRAQSISRLADGAFDVTIGPHVRLWRFARKRKVLPDPAEASAARKAVGYQHLQLDRRSRSVTLLAPNMRLDLGGIAKGYAADQALRVLKQNGITRALVAASGDIALGDAPPGQAGWRVAIAGLDDRSSPSNRAVLLKHCGVSTSGDTEQFIEIQGVRYSHILDPGTGLGLTNRIQATVIAPDATASDALATSVCVLGAARGLALVDSLPDTAALILTAEGEQAGSCASRRFARHALTLEVSRSLD